MTVNVREDPMPESYTDRGFACYATTKDDYGADVQVIESSAAMIEGEDRGPWVWIMVEGGGITDNKGAAHLNPTQARIVRDALSEWLGTVVDELNQPPSELIAAVKDASDQQDRQKP